MIKAIVFDLWNTLIPATIDFVHLSSLAKEEHSSLPEFIRRYETATQLKKYKSFEELKKDFFNEFKEEEDSLLYKELYEVYFNRFDKIRYFSDVEQNLVKLKKEGYKLAILSNTESLHAKKISGILRFSDYFDELVFSFDIRAIKPQKEAFTAVLNKLNVLPSEALMVGDSLRTDIIGSKSVGMHNCLMNRRGIVIDKANIKPEFEIKSFDELSRVLGVLNSNKSLDSKANLNKNLNLKENRKSKKVIK